MHKLNFPSQLIKWIMNCIATPSFSLSVNGNLCGFFRGKKGLRQGDPISLLLFVLVMDYFTRILKMMSWKARFSFIIDVLKWALLTSLVFADDLMLYYKRDVKSVILMVSALKAFSQASGLHAIIDKKDVYFGNVKEDIQKRVLQAIGFIKGTFPFR